MASFASRTGVLKRSGYSGENNMTAIIYDCEIIKAVPPNDGVGRMQGIEYCEGWRDFANMGVSVTGVYDYGERRYRVFCKDNLAELAKLIAERDLCVGFNSIPFDNALLLASQWPTPPAEKSYDLLRETWLADGLGPEFKYPSHIGYSLDQICEGNFGMRKSGNGAFAPVLWQQGRIGEVIDYCLNDVRMTKAFFDCVMRGDTITSPVTGKDLLLRIP